MYNVDNTNAKTVEKNVMFTNGSKEIRRLLPRKEAFMRGGQPKTFVFSVLTNIFNYLHIKESANL
ncbi:MAG: hypothetical protein LBC49_00745 [Bacteroidales bacterium]|jgi:hypothetical protein|nr:hypothetical protein [Bacteroidales bacterium]